MRGRPEINREPRLTYRGQVRLLVPFPPWRLLLTLSGLNLSSSGLLALLPVDFKDAAEVHALLVPGDPYELQLEHDSEHVSAPFLRARLVRTQRTTVGYELAFAFDDLESGQAGLSGLLGLVHELTLRS